MPKGRYQIMPLHAEGRQYGIDMCAGPARCRPSHSPRKPTWSRSCGCRSRCSRWRPLVANSPFTEGKPNGFLSFRSEIWPTPITRAPACCRGCSRTAWGSSAMSITRSTCPCIRQARRRLYRCRRFLVPRLLRGRNNSLPASVRPCRTGPTSVDDFPEVRLKRYLEMRGATACRGPVPALPASGRAAV